MRIYLSPQVRDEVIEYDFDKDKIKIKMGGIEESFDFSDLPDGILELEDGDGVLRVNTNLDPFPIISAEKKSGVLHLKLLNYISEDASYEERFPEWIDSIEYGSEVEHSPEKEELEDWSDF